MSTRIQETFAEQVYRLAAKARREGSELFQDEISGRWFASSRRHPGKLHQLSAISCTCPSFISRGYCGHLSLLLLELGYVPDDDPQPDPPAAAYPLPIFREIAEALEVSHMPAEYFERLAFGRLAQNDYEPSDIDTPDLLNLDCDVSDIRDFFSWHYASVQRTDLEALAA
jgi:hypothetical protein